MINLKNILTEADVFQDPNIDMDKVFMKGKDRNELTDEPAEEVEDLFKDLEKDIKSTDLEPKKVDEALGLTLAGVALSLPEIIKLIGKLVNLVKKIPGFKRLSGDRLIAIGDKWHHKITGAFEFIIKKAGVKDSNKAKKYLNWQCSLNLNQTINFLLDWYNNFYNKKKNIKKFSSNQIKLYLKIVNKNKK